MNGDLVRGTVRRMDEWSGTRQTNREVIKKWQVTKIEKNSENRENR